MPRALRTRSIRLLILPACALALAACSSSPSPSNSSSTTSSSSTTTTSARSATSTTSGGTTSTTSKTPSTLAPQTSTITEFYSPSKNISCEIDNNASSVTSALCLTLSPPKSATLKPDGSVIQCMGTDCLSNAGENTPTLAYGQTITLGPFTCASSTAGMKCTIANGDGFLISASGTLLVGAATVAPSTTSTTGTT